MMNIDQVLRNTLSSDQTIREDATKALEQVAAENLAHYSLLLCQALANESGDGYVRTAAGIALKNAFRVRDLKRQEFVQNQWMGVDENIKSQIKNAILFVLGSNDSQAASAASQVIQAIACIELPHGLWGDLIDKLLSNMTSESSTSNLKRSTLQTIGYICEEIDPKVLESASDRILTAVIQGARQEETDNMVRKEAILALSNSLDFVEKNFENKNERDYIMSVVFDALQSDVNVSAVAFQCLVKIVQIYYPKMPEYMMNGLYHKTIAGMQSPHSEIALQAIEFWSTICDVEIDISDGLVEFHLLKFALTAVKDIVPVLYNLILQKEEDEDEETWNVPMAAATCLSQFSICVQNNILDTQILEFIQRDLVSDNAKFRDCAVFAFGSIMEGPSTEYMGGHVHAALPMILKLLKDSSVSVRDSATFTLQKICQNHYRAIDPNIFGILIESLKDSLVDVPRVAANAAWAIMHLSESIQEAEENTLSSYFVKLAQALLIASSRPDSTEKYLRMASYQSLSTLIQVAGSENAQGVYDLTAMMIQNLRASLNTNVVSIEDSLILTDLQSFICSFLMNACGVLDSAVLPLSDEMMGILLSILKVNQGKKSALLEDVFLAIGSLSNAINKEFGKYASSFAPFLFEALKNHEEGQLCSVAVGLTGDLARALEEDVEPYCDAFADLLLKILQDPGVGRDIKTSALSTYGDLAMAIGVRFEKYLEITVRILFEAGSIAVDTSDIEEYEYIQDLYISILETFANFVQGMKTPQGGSKELLKYIPDVLQFIQFIARNGTKAQSVHRAAIGLLGDICDVFGSLISSLYRQNPWVMAYIDSYMNCDDDQTRQIAQWSRSNISRVI